MGQARDVTRREERLWVDGTRLGRGGEKRWERRTKGEATEVNR